MVPIAVLLFVLSFTFCLSASALQDSLQIQLNDRVNVPLTRDGTAIYFVAPSNNRFTFRSFGGEGAQAVLTTANESEPVASGVGFDFSARLVDGRTYQLLITGDFGHASIEIMRDTLGRSFDRPLILQELHSGYDKIIARAYDVHWYRFIPKGSGEYLIAAQSQIGTKGVLLDAAGAEVPGRVDGYTHMRDQFWLRANLIEGRPYYLRISAKDDDTGRYHLRFLFEDEAVKAPASLVMEPLDVQLMAGERIRLNAVLQPKGARSDLIWISANSEVARVNEDGVVSAVSVGETDIIALGLGEISGHCRVVVKSLPIEAIAFDQETISLPIGEPHPLSYTIVPEGASAARLQFSSTDESIVRVDPQGNALGVSEGEADIRLLCIDSGMLTSLRVKVTPPLAKRRALLIGQQRYFDGRIRIGSVNTTQGISDLLRAQNLPGESYEVTMKMDSTRDETLRYIRETFSGDDPRDVSLFYINCHGQYEKGIAYLEFYDGSRLSAQALELELRKVPGTVVVIIDCCNSGAFISKGDPAQFNRRLCDVFGGGPFAISKYRVLCSSGIDQNSYRNNLSGEDNENSWATVLGRSLCEAGGWDLQRERALSMKADINKDKQVTLNEAYQYVQRRVKHYLDDAADHQDVTVYPAGSQFVLFAK